MDRNRKADMEVVRDADRIIALALIRHLYNQGKISELVFRNIKKDTLNKISIENKEMIC